MSKWRADMDPISFAVRRACGLPLVVVGLAAFVFSYLVNQDIAVLNEGRTYFLNEGFLGTIDARTYWLFPTGSNTRYTSMVYAALVGRTCGLDGHCTNAFEALLVALQCMAFYLHGFQLLGSRARAAFVVALWLLSGAALSGILWQSIQHDKIAVTLMVLNLVIAVEFFRRDRPAIWLSPVYALLLVPALAVTFNAKEIGFFLPIAMTILGVIFGLRSPARLARNVLVLVPSLAYSAWYISWYYLHLQGYWAEHIAGGSIWPGLLKLVLLTLNLGDFFDLGHWTSSFDQRVWIAKVLYVAFALAFLGASALAVRTSARSAVQSLTPIGAIATFWREIYLLAVLCIFYGLFARTAFPASFYVMMPCWAGLCVLALVGGRVGAALHRPTAVAWALYTAFAAPFLLAYSTAYLPDGAVTRLRQDSRDMAEASAVIRRLIPDGGKVRKIVLATVGPIDGDWYILHGARSDAFDQDLPAYILDDPRARPDVERVAPEMFDCDGLGAGQLYVVLGKRYRIERMQLGPSVILRDGDGLSSCKRA